jgi:hypothetical protein
MTIHTRRMWRFRAATLVVTKVTAWRYSSKPGLYLQYQRRAPNNWSTPHYHPIARVVMVMGGTMRIGTGATGDKTRTVAVPKGGFIHDIARGVHYDGSGNDPMWILTAGVGPTATINVDPPK